MDSETLTSATTLADRSLDERSNALIIETEGLTKRYGERIVAVDDLTLRVRRGEVYGFLGANGAGKTTTLRMLLGLIRPTSGAIRVMGEPPGSPEGLAHIGALVETPAFYPYLSGWDNLRALALHAGTPQSRIPIVLEQVDLAGRARDAFKTYSLGMKQRLGVAAALLKDPELLILDEPTNGLDPAGMAEMRDLIRDFGRGDRTVLLSSHLMTEVEQICDRVGVIHSGKLIAEGTVDELRGRGGIRVRAYPIDKALRVASELDGVDEVQAMDDDTLRIAIDPADASWLNRQLINAGIEVSEIYREKASLEKVFLGLTKNGGNNDVE
jgi:ABC-2 type transport system ATP-binding protein